MAQPLQTFEEIGSKRRDSHRGGIAQKYVLDTPSRRLIQACYDGKTQTITELADRLHVPRSVVRKWACELGLARQKEPPWSDQEVQYLQTWLHRQSIAKIAKHLGRTQTAVRLKAKRLGIRKSGEGYTMQALCEGLGCDHHKVQRWVKLGWLKGERRETERTSQQGGDMWCFKDTALRDFIFAHPMEIDPRRADWLWLVAILSC